MLEVLCLLTVRIGSLMGPALIVQSHCVETKTPVLVPTLYWTTATPINQLHKQDT